MGGGASKRDLQTKTLCKAAIRGATGVADKEDKLKETFKAWDKDGNGVISKEELIEVFGKLGVKVSPSDAAKLLKEADTDQDSHVNFGEFISWLCVAPNLKAYFQASQDIMKRNLKDLCALTSKLEKEMGKASDPFAAMSKMAQQMEGLQKKSQARIDKELTPIIKKAFKYHDKDGSGVLEYDESIIFFSNFAELLGPFMQSTTELASAQNLTMAKVTSPPKTMEAFKKAFADRKAAYEKNIDACHQAAFKVLDVNGDGKLQETEVVEALLHGHPKNEEFMRALGLLVPPEELVGAAMEDVMGAVFSDEAMGDCQQQ
eukprot:gb/GFBE01005655.1/.p1 GENE.gb/GFBE01005655.1/~~gb/GFBE01005655.1/.p1  ORF type:complete len:317 (+),score=123.17 gb/GFBE01005655.1/:1-951(+)